MALVSSLVLLCGSHTSFEELHLNFLSGLIYAELLREGTGELLASPDGLARPCSLRLGPAASGCQIIQVYGLVLDRLSNNIGAVCKIARVGVLKCRTL